MPNNPNLADRHDVHALPTWFYASVHLPDKILAEVKPALDEGYHYNKTVFCSMNYDRIAGGNRVIIYGCCVDDECHGELQATMNRWRARMGLEPLPKTVGA